MHLKVLKAFAYARDGVHIEQLEEGAVADIRERHVKGLKAAGYVGDPDAKESAAPAPDAAAAEAGADAAAATKPKPDPKAK